MKKEVQLDANGHRKFGGINCYYDDGSYSRICILSE